MATEDKLVELEQRIRALEKPQEIRLTEGNGASEVVVRSSGFAIYKDGRLAAALTVQADGPVLTLFSSSGHPAAGIDVLGDSSALRLFDDRGVPKMEFQVVDGVPEIYLLDDQGNRRVEMDAVAGASMVLSDGEGQVRVQLSVSDSGKVTSRFE